MGILQMVSAEFPMVLIRRHCLANFNMLKKEVKKPHLAKFFAENPRLYLRLKSFDSRLLAAHHTQPWPRHLVQIRQFAANFPVCRGHQRVNATYRFRRALSTR